MSPVCTCGHLQREHGNLRKTHPAGWGKAIRPPHRGPFEAPLNPCRVGGRKKDHCRCLRFVDQRGMVGLQGDLLTGEYRPLKARA